MKRILLAFLFLPMLTIAQTGTYGEVVKYKDLTEGLKFEHGLSWKEIQAKAKAENKYIIMDCFTTWCGPCTYMTNTIFPKKEVGDFFNDKYLAVKVQFDTTKNDNDEVKAWFADMQDINAKYKVRAYPTYLIFDPNGTIVHRAVGAHPDPNMFIEKGKDGMTPEKQYYTQLRKYEAGKKDPEFLRNLAVVAQGAYDMDNAAKISDEYLATQTDLYTKDNIEFVNKFTGKSSDKGFAMMRDHPEKVDAVLGEGKSKERVLAIISAEELNPGLRKALMDKTVTTPDFSVFTENAIKKYPQYAADIQDRSNKSKISFYLSKKDWNGFQTEVVGYMSKNGDKATPAELNSYAWSVFENCKDMTCVTEALDWSKRSFKEKQEPAYMDTYANILHKLGKTKEAIAVEEQAIALLTDEASRKTYQETLDKMKKGEKTWTDK